MKTLTLLMLLASAGCSSAPFEPSTTDAGVAPDAADAAPSEAAADVSPPPPTPKIGDPCDNGAGTLQTGAYLCLNIMQDLCSRRFQCQAGGSCPNCANLCKTGSSCSIATCEAAMQDPLHGDAQGFICANYHSVLRCDTSIARCLEGVTQIACSDSQMNTWRWPLSCDSFWGSFPSP